MKRKSATSNFERNFKIITKRPAKMSFKEYKNHLKNQEAWLKSRKKGFLVYKASEIYEMELQDEKGEKHKEKMRRTFAPFRGVVDDLKSI